MKKICLFSLPFLFACGIDVQMQNESFAAQEVFISKAAICENLDASVRSDMDAGTYEKLCGHPKICEEFEAEMVCDGDWCVIHRSCRVN